MKLFERLNIIPSQLQYCACNNYLLHENVLWASPLLLPPPFFFFWGGGGNGRFGQSLLLGCLNMNTVFLRSFNLSGNSHFDLL